MPISVKCVDDQYVVLHCEGDVLVDDFVKANDYIYAELDARLARLQIVDLTTATRIELSAEDVQRLADQDRRAVDVIDRVAIAVVAPKDFAFGLARMWEAYADAPDVVTAVFRDLDTARDWLRGVGA